MFRSKPIIVKKEGKFTSDAFPPDADEDISEKNQYVAEVHHLLLDSEHSQLKELVKTPGKLRYTSEVNEEYIHQLDHLHKEFFPVEYGDLFFQYIRRGELRTLNCLAMLPDKSDNPVPQEKEYIVGCLVYKVKDFDTSQLSYWEQTKLMFKKKKYSAHIYTLGVVHEFRGTGLAQNLFSKFLELECKPNQIKHLFLDCASYNKSALKFYQKAGFLALKRTQNYYHIFGKDYDSIQMGLYLDEFACYNKPLDVGFDI